MILNNPVNVTPPTYTRKSGEVRSFKPLVVKELDLVIMDDVKNKSVSVRINSFPVQLVLWNKENYDTIGDYTQTQVENRVLELLGNDLASSLSKLFVLPTRG